MKNRIITLTGITELHYAELVERTGYAFVDKYTNGDRLAVEYLTHEAYFWAWWKSQWNLRDEVFVSQYHTYAGVGAEKELYELWLQHHCIEQIPAFVMYMNFYQASVKARKVAP